MNYALLAHSRAALKQIAHGRLLHSIRYVLLSFHFPVSIYNVIPIFIFVYIPVCIPSYFHSYFCRVHSFHIPYLHFHIPYVRVPIPILYTRTYGSIISCSFPIPVTPCFHSSHTHVVADRGMCWEDAYALGAQAKGKGSGFYRSKREQYHRHLYLLALQKENSSHLFNIIR